eukprot:NODE_354_length_10253_cov_0.271519.p2 type:complete len:321 gc:universal NODE_354_length_10253_cov_0.271519:1473-511(-)
MSTVGAEIFGISSLFLASFIISISVAIVKLVSGYMDVFDIILWQSTTQITLSLFGCILFQVNPFEDFIFKQLQAGIFSTGTFVLGFWGAVNMELSDATILKFTAPLFTMILARYYLKESISWFKKIGMILGFVGVILTARPPFLFKQAMSTGHYYAHRDYAVIAVIGSSLCMACSTIATKQLANKVHYFSLMFYMSAVYLLFAVPLKYFQNAELELDGLPVVVLLTVGFLVGQVFGFIGISFVPAAIVTLVKNMDTFFGVLFGVILFKEQLEWNTIAGCSMIFAVTIVLVIENAYSGRKLQKKTLDDSNITIKSSVTEVA